MASKNQAWMVALGSGTDPLPEKWVKERPDLLEAWPQGQNDPTGIESGSRLLYYAAHHKKLIGAGRASEDGRNARGTLRVQTFIAVPLIPFAPNWEVLGKPSGAIQGTKAITLSDAEYERGLDALLDRARPRKD
jgi:hypothetical protein